VAGLVDEVETLDLGRGDEEIVALISGVHEVGDAAAVVGGRPRGSSDRQVAGAHDVNRYMTAVCVVTSA
jgi:hypothetical protein